MKFHSFIFSFKTFLFLLFSPSPPLNHLSLPNKIFILAEVLIIYRQQQQHVKAKRTQLKWNLRHFYPLPRVSDASEFYCAKSSVGNEPKSQLYESAHCVAHFTQNFATALSISCRLGTNLIQNILFKSFFLKPYFIYFTLSIVLLLDQNSYFFSEFPPFLSHWHFFTKELSSDFFTFAELRLLAKVRKYDSQTHQVMRKKIKYSSRGFRLAPLVKGVVRFSFSFGAPRV